jgi:chromosome segregation ATPase
LAREEAMPAPADGVKPSESAATNRIIERGKATAEEVLLKYEEDAVAVERRFERFETIAAQRRNAIEREQAKWDALWTGKNATAESRIEELRKQLRDVEGAAVLDDRWQKLTGEVAILEEQLRAQTHEIEALTGKSEAERAQIKQEERELKEEKEKLKSDVSALSQKLIGQKVEMETLRHQEEVVKLRTKDLAKGRTVAQTRLDIATKVLEVFQRQLTQAERKYQTLRHGTVRRVDCPKYCFML